MTQLFDLIRYSARDVAGPGWDQATGFGVLDIPRALTLPLPPVDPQEPNDDIDQVKAGGLFSTATPSLTRPGRGHARIDAFIDFYEDPVDVYRVSVPRGLEVIAALRPRGGNVDLEFFQPKAETVYYTNRRAALRGALIGGSYRTGTKPDILGVINNTGRGAYVYLGLYKTRGQVYDAGYSLQLATVRPRQ
jgi:hypothetical protein